MTLAAGVLAAAGPASAQEPGAVLPPSSYTASDCAGEAPVVAASDAAAQSDLYSSVTLAGVLGTDCVVLSGPRGEPMATDQLARLEAAGSGGFIVGGTAAVPDSKVAGFELTRLAGTDRWHTARLVGAQALIAAGGTDTGTVEASAGAEDPTVDCTGNVPILVASDEAAQSDLYSAVTLAGVVGTDCIILTGPRDGSWPDDQMERAKAAMTNNVLSGYIVGGEAAVPLSKFEGLSYSLTRLAGDDRWQTARLVGDRARSIASSQDTEPEDTEPEDTEAPDEEAEDAEAAATATFTALSAGMHHTCALRDDGTVACWGLDNYGQSSPPEGTFTAVAAGGFHTCVLRGDGTVACWGNDEDGQSSPPTTSFRAVAAGLGHTCGIKLDDRVECWGADDFGQASSPGGGFRTISAGTGHTCGLLIDDWFQCWGQIDGLNRGNFTALSAAVGQQVCLLEAAGSILCWGRIYGSGPTRVTNELGPFSAVATGGRHGCGIIRGAIACWGDNSHGQLSPFEEGSAVIRLDGHYVAVVAGDRHTCGLVNDGRLGCWGADDVGQSTPPTS